MSRYKVARKASTNEIEIYPYDKSPTSGFTVIGNFYHADLGSNAADSSDEFGEGFNILPTLGTTAKTDNLDAGTHTVFQHIQDLLYKAGDFNIWKYSIIMRQVTGLSSSPATVTLAAAATQQITNTFTPVNGVDQRVTYATSNAAKATVNSTGLITAVASGSATITVTHTATGLTDTCVVTVS